MILQSPNLEGFVQRPVVADNHELVLVFPEHIGVKWTKQNLIFRSSVWKVDGGKWELVSAGFKKFFNWGEQPDLAYTPFSMTANGGVRLLEKLDGSLLIISEYEGNLIARTRGTIDASIMTNGFELELMKKKYPKAFKNSLLEDNRYSLLFEWVSPTNRIVLRYPEPDLYLIGAIEHSDYSMMPQNALDGWAEVFGLKRPKYFSFGSLKEMQAAVAEFKDLEGICVYCNNDQEIRKLKSISYLTKHRLKDELRSFDKLTDFYFSQSTPNLEDFLKSIEDLFDFETSQECKPDAEEIVNGMAKVREILSEITTFVETLKELSRKQAATEILYKYKEKFWTGYAFTILDNKSFTDKEYKKLLYQVLNKS